MPALKFTVDAALLRELGERLVGAPHIALAELIKNSYDADATKVTVRIERDAIEIVDDGHGMDPRRFQQYWMRIGSPHKAKAERSPRFGRPLTGSKGVGRLSAQFLASDLELATRAHGRRYVTRARVDWTRAVRARQLTEAKAMVDYRAPDESFADGSRTGTRLTLRRLHQTWDARALQDLGRELWSLQPPFGRSAGGEARAEDFAVMLETSDPEAQAQFENQMRAVLKLWEARIRGSVVTRKTAKGPVRHVEVTVEFDDDTRYRLEDDRPLQHLDAVAFDVRVFSLHHRQRYRIRVDDARDYLRAFGGVHIYDAGFHLPYYGPDTDWLGIEQAHAHRLSQSELLPDRWQVPGGLEYLPTNSRLYGVVEVDTGHEQAAARRRRRAPRNALAIQVSRDRLVGNAAFRELRDVVRTAMDFYATRAAARVATAKENLPPPGDLLDAGAQRFEDVVESLKEELSPEAYQALSEAARDVERAAETEAQEIVRQAGLLGALATAGIAAVANEHEASRQLSELERLRRRLAQTESDEAKELAHELGDWIKRARSTRRLFGPLLDESSRDDARPLRAASLLEQVEEQTRVLMRGVRCDLAGVEAGLMLPSGTYAEWSALWQNVFVNASNAMLDNDDARLLKAVSEPRTRGHAVILMDTGSGIDLDDAERLFEPFERAQEISQERRGLGAGGTGLGLTIVRMIARKLRCEVRFVPPPDPRYSTAFELSWRAS